MQHRFMFLFLFFCNPTLVYGLAYADHTEEILHADSGQLKSMLLDAMTSLQQVAVKTSGYGDYNVFGDHSTGKAIPKPEVWKISVCGEDCMSIARKEGAIEVLEVANKDYSFVLTRPKKGGYSVVGVQKVGVSAADDQLIREKMNTARYYLLDAYSYYGRTIWGLVRDTGFLFKEIKAYKDDSGKVRVRVEFSYAPVKKATETIKNIDDWTLTNPYLVFSPGESWALVEYGRPAYPRSIETLPDTPKGQLSFTRTATLRVLDEKKNVTSDDSIECISSNYDPIPKEHFYLSHYGFPEPNFSTPSRWPWILGGLLLSAALFLTARKMLRR